jgi:hypothetical protein
MAFELTQGQPWLVNALAKEVVEKLIKDHAVAITPVHIFQAKEILIARRDTHLDSLAERLREPRVKAIIEPILSGQALGDVPSDDRQYLVDLGLLHRDPAGGLVVANPIYGEPLLGTTSYHEIAPHIVLMAFLHRVVNGSTSSPRRGGGTLEREYAIGSDRMDLCLRYGGVTLGIELKVWREKKGDPQAAGIEQLESYLARLGLNEGWLLVFDRRVNALPIQERLGTQVVQTENGRA